MIMGVYAGTTLSWNQLSKNLDFFASGGVVTEAINSGIVYRVHSFTNVGISTFVVNRPIKIEYLIVGGGGGSGAVSANNASGAGGAGGLLTNLGGTPAELTAQNYTLTVGGGGAGGIAVNGDRGQNGGNSSFLDFTALGGGGGGGNITIFLTGSSGGSGGGGGNNSTGGSGTSGQGNDGGDNFGTGGGAGQSGNDGGNGLELNITGTPLYYAGGGARPFSTARPLGGGGFGDSTNGGGDSTDGEPNTGGGGGARWGAGIPGRIGGSGVIIVRYQIGVVGQ